LVDANPRIGITATLSQMSEPPSSPPTDLSTPENALAYYKAQYEQLEHELAEFQASSQELEAELEKDVEAAEKRERVLQEKAESLGFEVDEWKVCEIYISFFATCSVASDGTIYS